MIFFWLVIIVIIVFVLVKSSQGNKINIAEIHSSGILNKCEEITEHFRGTYFKVRNLSGVVVFTNKRFLFLQKASGWGSKGFNVLMFCSWGDVVSVSTSGSNKINLNVKNNDKIDMNLFFCNQAVDVAKKIIENKNNFVEKTVIEAKTVIIEEGNNDNAMKILQKRLARGEITLEEFNKLVTRT
jgi:uncharacterized membrane protein